MTTPTIAADTVATGLKAQVLHENLTAALRRVTGAVSAKSTLPIIHNVLIESHAGRLRLTCTDLELTASAYCGARVEAEGATTVNAALFTRAVAALPKQPIDFDASGRRNLQMTCGRAEQRMATMDAADFPRTPAIEDETACEMDGGALETAIKRVLFGVAIDLLRPSLTGVHWSAKDGGLTLAAADGFRLLVASVPGLAGVTLPDIVVPGRAIRELVSMLPRAPIVVRVNRAHSRVAFDMGDTTLVSQLIQEAFPKYGQLMPAESETAVAITVDAAALRDAIGVVEPYAREGSGIIRFRVLDSRTLHVSATANETGAGEMLVDVETSGDISGARVALNQRYIREALSEIEGRAVLRLITASQQVVLVPAEDDGADYRQVIMPMFIQWES